MTDDEIKVLAREADAEHSDVVLTPFLRRFAALVAERAAAAEREACARVLDAAVRQHTVSRESAVLRSGADAIRARSKA